MTGLWPLCQLIVIVKLWVIVTQDVLSVFWSTEDSLMSPIALRHLQFLTLFRLKEPNQINVI